MKKEEWKDIQGYEGLYQVSNLDRIKSLNYNHTGKEELLKLKKNSCGYLHVGLYKDGKIKTLIVHRLVAQAFLDSYSDDLEVDHINTIRDDNRVENLRVCTHKENSNNPLTVKNYSKAHSGKNNPMYGKHLSEEIKKKISESRKGIHHTEEARKKISEAHKGVNNPNASAVVCMENGKIYSTIKQASEELNLLLTGISACCRGVSKSTKGYHFNYAKTEGENNESL